MALVVGVFQPADHRSRRPDPLGQLLLRQPGAGPKVVDLQGDVQVSPFFLEQGHHLRLALEIPAVENFHRVGGGFSLARHYCT